MLYDEVTERGRDRESVTKKKGDKETGTRFPAMYFSQKRLLKF